MVNKTTMEEKSQSLSLNNTDWKKIGKGAAIAFGAAFLWSILIWLQVWLSTGQVEWNVFGKTFMTVCFPAALSTGINALIKYLQGPKT